MVKNNVAGAAWCQVCMYVRMYVCMYVCCMYACLHVVLCMHKNIKMERKAIESQDVFSAVWSGKAGCPRE